ncbi:MAG TPA: thioredoxin [Geminicoccaceae bacterium]|nr:thioredoxin [Geminicoccus sp.]HMU52022.1 thioredoxin [Geminicoccaceae bacterium]
MIKHVTDASFATEVLGVDGPVLVDFWAEWCGPCRQIAPVLDALASEHAGKVTIAKVNVDENPATPNRYGVRSIPALLLFDRGRLVDQRVGAAPRAQIDAWLRNAVAA